MDGLRLHGTAGGDGLEARVAEATARILGSVLPAGVRMALDTPLVEYRISSLSAVRLRIELHRQLAVDLPMQQLIECTNLSQLNGWIARQLASRTDSPLRAGATAEQLTPGGEEAARFEPFALTDIQQAYVMGKQSTRAGDAMGCHLYREIEIEGLDVARLQAAWQRVVDHFDMLRVELTDDGRQRVRAECRQWPLPVHEVARATRQDRDAVVARVRTAMSHQGFAAGDWPLFRVQVAHWREGASVVHLGIDGALCDGAGLELLLDAWGRCYEDPRCTLPQPEGSVRDAVQTLLARRGTPAYERALEYWLKRLALCPEGPKIGGAAGLVPASGSGDLSRRAFSGRLDASELAVLARKAEQLGVSPTSLVLSLFAETLARAGSPRPFSLVLTTNYRPWLGPRVEQLVGPFTGTLVFIVEDAAGASWEESTQQLHQRLWQDLEHAEVGGVATLRELRRRKVSVPAALPVVFTSLLDVCAAGERPGSFAPRVRYAVSQTSGVALDHQMWEREGQLHLHWDVAEDAFPTGAIERLFCSFLGALRTCASSDGEAAHRHPLNELQKAYFVARAGGEQVGDGCQVYQSFHVRDLDVGRLERALLRMIESYDVLRTVIGTDGQAHVRPRAPSRFEIPVVDLSRSRDPARYLAVLCKELVSRAYPLGRWPMFDVCVTRDGTAESMVHVCIDLALCDGMSLHFLARELLRLSVSADTEARPHPALPLAAYEGETAALRASPELPTWVDSWRRRLAELPPGPPIRKDATHRDRVRLQGTIPEWQRVKAAAAAHGIAPDMILAAALGGVLEAWYPGAPFSLPVVQWLPDVAKYRPCELTALTWVTERAVGASMLDRAAAYTRQLASDPPSAAVSGLAELRKRVMRERRRGAFALPVVYTSTLDLSAMPLPPGVRLGPWMTYTPDVSLDCISVEEGGELCYVWDAVEADFPEGRLRAMFAGFRAVLDALAADPARLPTLDGVTLAAVARNDGNACAPSLAAPIDRDTMLHAWNDTARPFPAARPGHHLFEDRVREQPAATALRTIDGSLTYGELNRHANRIAWHLRSLGVGPQTVVGVSVGRGLAMVAAVLGVLKAGGAYLPIDASLPIERVKSLMSEARAGYLLAEAAVAGRVRAHVLDAWRIVEIDRDVARMFSDEPSHDPEPSAAVDNTAYIIFTSGSTGTPKGIAVAHRSVLNLLAWCYRTFQFSASDVGLAVASLSFDLSVFDLFGLLGCGACLYLANEEQQKDPTLLLEILIQERITFWNSAPAVLHQLAPHFASIPGGADTHHLRLVFLSGDYTPLALPDEVRATFSNACIVNLGGATEATVWSNYYVVGTIDRSWRSIPYGKPIDNARYYVLDDQLEPCPVGVEGDLYIAGDVLSLGYVNRPELTAQSFVSDPFARTGGERMYRTGDRASYYPDGNLSFLGRKDHQVKIRGFRVELGEIEHRIRGFPGIKDVVVLVRVDHAGDQKIVAYATTHPGAAPSVKDVRAHAGEALPAYMVPNHVVFLSELPATVHGKIDRGALPWPLEAAAVEPPAQAPGPNRQEITAVVTELFAEALARSSIDPTQDLWDMGATSFNMVQVSGGLQRRFGCRVPVAALVEDATVAGIVRVLENQLGQPTAPRPASAPPASTNGASTDPALTVAAPYDAAPVDLFDAAQVARFKSRRLQLRPAASGECSIALPDVRPPDAYFTARATRRQFASGQVTFEQLARLLSFLRPGAGDGHPSHLYASAGGTYAVQLYVHVKRNGVAGIDPGVYYYEPHQHALRHISDGTSFERTVHFPYNRPVFDRAAFELFLIGQLDAIAPLYQADAERFLLIEAGYMGQLLTMAQDETRIGLCPIGSLAFEKIRAEFRLDQGHRFLHGFLGGLDAHARDAARPVAFFAEPRAARDEIAIVGVAGRYPGADTPRALWHLLRTGKRAIGELSPGRRDDLLGREAPPPQRLLGGFLGDIGRFDSLLFHISPREAKDLDPQIRFALEVVWECLEDAGYTPESLRACARRVGVFVAVMWHDYQHVGSDLLARTGAATVAGMSSDIANRVSHFFGFAGPSIAVGTSCSSSVAALHAAQSSLVNGDCDAAVVVAVNLVAHPYHIGLLDGHGLLAATDEPVAFDPASAGWLPGEGCGAVLLRSAAAAGHDGDDVRAILEGTWVAHAGRARRFAAPDADALARSIGDALGAARVAPADIGYVECAAAGASIADAAEIEALEQVFGGVPGPQLPVGTLKPNIGHLEAASGMSQLTKVLLQLRARQLAPTLVARADNPLVPWSRLHVRAVDRLAPWDAGPSGAPRRALVNAVGATGSYAHAIVREAPRPEPSMAEARQPHVVLLSAASHEQLTEQARRWRDALATASREGGAPRLADVAFTSQVGRVAMAHRLALQCRDRDELIAGLAAFLRGEAAPGLRVSEVEPSDEPPLAPATAALAVGRWLEGSAVEWAKYWDASARRVALPTYPFAGERHWLDARPPVVSAASHGTDSRARIERYLIDLYAELSGIPKAKLRARTSLDRYGINSSLIAQLNERLARDFGDIPRTLFFEHRDLAGVAGSLDARSGGAAVAPAGEPPDPSGARLALDADDRIAIIGLAGRYPGASDLDDLWQGLLEGRDRIRRIPESRTRPGWPVERMWGGFLDEVDRFDPLFFQISPRDAELMSPEERLFLEVAWETMEDAGYGRRRLRDQHGGSCGVFAGAMYNEYPFFGVEQSLRGSPAYSGSAIAGIANRVSYFLDLRGPSLTVDTMCSASLACLHLAVESLRRGECELALAGGVNLCLHPNKFVQLDGLRMGSSDHRCRAFGAGGDGFVPGEGAGAVLLKPLRRAIADGDRVHAVLLGTAVNHGGRTNGYMVPDPLAQADVILQALRRARVSPATIGYVEAHGTGTELGDPIEIDGLSRAFAAAGPSLAIGACAIGSAKTSLGHLEAAAGIAGLSKLILQMKHRRFAPSLHAQTLNPNIDWARSPFRVQGEAAEWPQLRGDDGALIPRRGCVSSFGAGGTNAHVVVEAFEASPQVARPAWPERQLIILSARDRARLEAMAARLARFVRRSDTSVALPDVAFTLQVGRDSFRERLAVLVSSHEELADALERFSQHEPSAVIAARAAEDPPAGSPPSDLEELARYWTSGGDVDWRGRNGDRTARIVSLPTYPFAKLRCWLPEADAPASPHPEPPVASDQEVRLYEKGWRATEPAPASPRLAGGVVCLFHERSQSVARALAQALGADRVVLTREGEALPERAARALAWIDLGDLHRVDGDAESWRVRLAMLQSWLTHRHGDERRVVHVTAGLHVVRTPSASSPVGAHLAAIVQLLEAESAKLRARTVDTDLPPERPLAIADQITAELAANDVVGAVSYRAGRRHVPELRPIDGPLAAPPRLDPDQVYVVSGGTRGIGALVARHLVDLGARKLLLLCAGPLPTTDAGWDDPRLPEAAKRARETERALSRSGVQVKLHAGSLADRARTNDALREARRTLGPVGGIVHCAGRASHGTPTFWRKSTDDVAATFLPKVDGLDALAHACRDDDLGFFLSFSSVSAVVPALAAGVLDYAAANAYLEIFAGQQVARGKRTMRAVAWPAWRESSASRQAIDACQGVGIAAIEPGAALAALDRILCLPPAPSVVVLPPARPDLDADALLREGRRPRPPATQPEDGTVAHGRGALGWLVGLLSHELRIPAGDLDVTATFTELGVESVMLGELVQKIEARVGRPIEPSMLLEHATLERLSARLVELAGDAASADEAPTPSAGAPAVAHVPAQPVASPASVARPRSGSGDAIAVIGMSARFPGAPDLDAFWANLVAGRCAIGEVPRDRWDAQALYSTRYERGKTTSKWGGFVDGVADFDPDFFGMTHDEATRCDPAIRLFLEGVAACIADAGYARGELAGGDAGVFAGARMSGYRRRIRLPPDAAPLGGAQNFIAAYVAHCFDLHGPNLVVDSACSSALVAVKLACQSLLAGESQLAIAGGVEILLDEEPYIEFSAARALSPTGRCRTFDRGADGFVPGEGCGVVLLKPLAHARRDGDRIRGVIRAVAVNNDGATMGLTTPNPTAQADVVRRALRSSGLAPEAVGMIEAHGTATMIGDPIELRALTDAFRSATSRTASCAIGSVKSNVGHLLSAAGIAGLIKAILAVEHGQIPPTLFCDVPNPRFDFSASPFFPNRELRDWPAEPGARVAGVSAFGLGGTNAHAIVTDLGVDRRASGATVRAPLPAPSFQRRRCWLERADESSAPAPAAPRELDASILDLDFVVGAS